LDNPDFYLGGKSMTMYTLTLLDVRRIQAYLFSANELKQCLGGSALVEMATHDWIIEALPSPNNIQTIKPAIKFNNLGIETLAAEVIFLGGGNAAILFQDRKRAHEFAGKYSRLVLANAPGLEVAIAHVDCDWSKPEGLKKAWKEMQDTAMPGQKEGRITSQPLLGLGVTAECAFTGLPAVAETPDPDSPERGVLVSSEALAKHSDVTIKGARSRINDLIPLQTYQYPDRFEDLGGEKGRSSSIAVVHADGNGIGKRLQAYCSDSDNQLMLNKMRAFSEAINTISLDAMQKVVGWLEKAIHEDAILDRWYAEESIQIRNKNFPVRPIIFGGDDVTFVCEGRLGMALAVKFIQELQNASMPDGLPVYACAGVAVVSSHYPFSRAYQLAEELTRAAKKQAWRYDQGLSRVSLINWHISTAGLALNWEEICKREYQDGKLLYRPLVVNQDNAATIERWRTWDVFLKQVDAFRNSENDPQKWNFGRNKLKELREVLRAGKEETRKFTSLNSLLPDTGLPELDSARAEGWFDQRCVYFDALEVDDFFILPKEA
jgi:hypothetical protein